MPKQSTALAKVASDESVAALMNEFPVEEGMSKTFLPRLVYRSQDKWEGTGRNKKMVYPAGTFFLNIETEEVDEEGKKVWDDIELGDTIEGVILFVRKQLKYFEEGVGFTSSPVYDEDTEEVPLFLAKKEVARGTPSELKAKYAYTDEKTGKKKSNLEDYRILYILFQGPDDEAAKLYELSLRGSSMYEFRTYTRKTAVPAVLTKFASVPKTQGSNEWNQMTFDPVRKLSESEVQEVLTHVREIKGGIAMVKAQYGNGKLGDSGSELEAEFIEKK